MWLLQVLPVLPLGLVSNELLYFNLSCGLLLKELHPPAPYVPLNKYYFEKVITIGVEQYGGVILAADLGKCLLGADS